MRIVATGPKVLVVDGGVRGYNSLGYADGGAYDTAALVAANRLVGNVEEAAGLEVILGGLRFVCDRDELFAVTGAPVTVSVDGVDVGTHRPVAVAAGSEVSLGMAVCGLRAYVAFRGGIDVEVPPGGLHPLAAGDNVDLGAPLVVPPTFGIDPGPRWDWFTDDALAALVEQTWTMTPATDRVGMRLAGEALTRRRSGELASEGLVPGAIQVPTDGQPLVFGVDHPVTGGYPVIAVVPRHELGALCQIRPGEQLRFRWRVTPDT